MRNALPEALLPKIVERPEHLGVSIHTERSKKYNELALMLNNMAATKALAFSVPELTKMFGKTWKGNIKWHMRQRKIKCVIALESEVVYIWKRGA